MPKEKPILNPENFDLVKNLDPQTKMGVILEIFDIGPDKDRNRQRKEDFIKLMRKYHEQGIIHRASRSPGSNITSSEIKNIHSSDENKKKLHDQIMETLRNMSLSLGLKKEQRLLAEYLQRDRSEVERLIQYYFSVKDPIKTTTSSEYLKTKEKIAYLNKQTGPEEE